MTLPEGYKTFITHFRRFDGEEYFMTSYDAGLEGIKDRMLHQGGATEALVVDPEGNAVATGLSVCSERDNFSKKIGRNIAVGRAVKNFARPSEHKE